MANRLMLQAPSAAPQSTTSNAVSRYVQATGGMAPRTRGMFADRDFRAGREDKMLERTDSNMQFYEKLKMERDKMAMKQVMETLKAGLGGAFDIATLGAAGAMGKLGKLFGFDEE